MTEVQNIHISLVVCHITGTNIYTCAKLMHISSCTVICSSEMLLDQKTAAFLHIIFTACDLFFKCPFLRFSEKLSNLWEYGSKLW